MATLAKSEQPESGDKGVLEVADERSQGPENFQGIQDIDARPRNKLDDLAGGDAKKARLALSNDGPYGEKVGKEGNMIRRTAIIHKASCERQGCGGIRFSRLLTSFHQAPTVAVPSPNLRKRSTLSN